MSAHLLLAVERRVDLVGLGLAVGVAGLLDRDDAGLQARDDLAGALRVGVPQPHPVRLAGRPELARLHRRGDDLVPLAVAVPLRLRLEALEAVLALLVRRRVDAQ